MQTKAKATGGIRYAGYVVRKSPLSALGVFLILLVLGMAVFAPLLAPYGPYQVDMSEALRAPSRDHWLGTDSVGRDILSRLLYGARISLKVAFVVVSIAATAGTLLGVISGYYGGIADMLIMRVVEVFLAVPTFVLAMVAAASLGPSITNVMLALSIVWWTWYARIVRGEVLKLKGMPFFLAERSLGAGSCRLIFRHLLPNCIGPILVQTTLQLGFAILAAAGLSFLGLGSQPPSPCWGLMVSEGRQYLPDYWWIATFPGLAIVAIAMGFILLGDTLRDIAERDLQ